MSKKIAEQEKHIELINEQKSKLEAFITEQREKILDHENEIEKKKKEIKNLKTDIYELEEHQKVVLIKEREISESWNRKFESEQTRCANLAEKILGLERKIALEIGQKEELKIKLFEVEKMMSTQEQIVSDSKYNMSEQVKQKEIYEREYKIMKNLYDGLKTDSAVQVEQLKKEVEEIRYSFSEYYHPMVVEEILSRYDETLHKVKALETTLIEEVQKNSNQEYRTAKKNKIIKKLQKIAVNLLEERKVLVKEREDLLYEALKLKSREKAAKQHSQNLLMEIRDLRSQTYALRELLVKESAKVATTPNKEPEHDEVATVKKHREEIIKSLKDKTTTKKDRPKSSGPESQEKPKSAQTSKVVLPSLPMRPNSSDLKRRMSLKGGIKALKDFSGGKKNLNLTFQEEPRPFLDFNSSYLEENASFTLIEELFVNSLMICIYPFFRTPSCL